MTSRTSLTAPRTFHSACAVVGVGNLLWADEGFGVRCLEALQAHYCPPADTVLVDGGTLGLGLLETFTTTRDLLILDCADLHAPPGTLRVLEETAITPWATTRLSAHQGGVAEVLAAAALLGKSPDRVAVVAVQPECLEDYGGSLSEVVRAQLGPATEAALGVLSAWGHPFTPRVAQNAAPALTVPALSAAHYEAERPSAEAACRTGDPRFAYATGGPSPCVSRYP